MAASWLAMLKNVPWGDVIASAPQLANTAGKLWKSVAGRPSTSAADPLGEAASDPLAGMALRLEHTEAVLTELHNQILSSSEIIARLADQNSRLIEQMEASRVRIWYLGIGTACAVLVAFVCVIFTAIGK
jgi:uncharacterized coiled-coil protein SlyX